jgi:hypothetical protein
MTDFHASHVADAFCQRSRQRNLRTGRPGRERGDLARRFAVEFAWGDRWGVWFEP